MKKIISFTMLLAVAAMALSSCAKDELRDEKNGIATNATVLHITAASEETKTFFGEKNNNKYPTTWTTAKKVRFSPNDTKSEVDLTPVLAEEGASATFEPVFENLEPNGTLYAFSPVGVYSSTPSKCVPGFTGFTTLNDEDAIYINIPSEQTPLANSVEEAAHAMVASQSYTDGNTSITMNFHHIVAYGKMTIANYTGTIKSVKLQFPENVTGGSCKYAYKTGDWGGKTGNTITLNPSNVVGNVFWFALAPTDGNTGEMKIIITDNDDSESVKTIDLTQKALPFIAGQVSAFSANFGSVVKEMSFTWDLSEASYSSASTTLVSWTNAAATMTTSKGEGTAVDNYLGGGGHSESRVYNKNTLAIAPGTGCEIKKVKITCTSETVASYINSGWTNASVTQDGAVLTVTPTDGTTAFSKMPSTTVKITSVQVFYVATSAKELSSISLSGTYPTAFNTGDEFSHEGMTVTAYYDDNSNSDVTASATFSGYDLETSGNQTVTVSYTEVATTKTAQYNITVTATPLILVEDIEVPAIGGTNWDATYTPKYFSTDDVEVATVSGQVTAATRTGSGHITCTIAPNYTTTAKSGTIVLQSASNHEVTKTINVSQPKSTLSVSDLEVTIPYNATSASFTLTTKEMGWNIAVNQADGKNLSVSAASGNADDGAQTVTVSSTTEASSSEILTLGTILVYRNGNASDSQKKTITVKKAKGAGAGISGLPAEFSMTTGTANTISGAGNTSATLTYFNASGVATNMTGYSGGFAVGSIPVGGYFLITIPNITLLSDTVVKVSMGGVKTSNSKYKSTYQVSWSKDGTSFTNVGATFEETTTAKLTEREITPGEITAGTLYIKVLCTSRTSGGGNHYLGTVTINTL